MFKKAVCPHCQTIYDRKEINSQKDSEIIVCHNCKKKFVVKKKTGFALLMAITFLFAVIMNIFLLGVFKVRDVVPLLISTVVVMIIGYLLRYLFVKYKKF